MKKRIWELDFLRGFAIIMMVFDHLMYDFAILPTLFGNFYNVNNSVFNFLKDLGVDYWSSGLRFYGHLFFVSLFLIVSGISYTFSKSNLSRGLKLLAVALAITVVTIVLENFLTNALIIFGIIHLYAFSILIIYLLRKLVKNEMILLVIAFIIIGVGFIFKFYDLEYLSSFRVQDLPKIILGINAFGADYFGLFPYMGIILLGTVLGNTFYQAKTSLIPGVKMSDKNIFQIAGRKSLLIFVTHQFILFAFIYLVGYIFGYRY
jgi:uncharacterized membrane protein